MNEYLIVENIKCQFDILSMRNAIMPIFISINEALHCKINKAELSLPRTSISINSNFLFHGDFEWLYIWLLYILDENNQNFTGTETRKKRNLAVYEAIVFDAYLRNHLRYKKSIFHFLHQFLKSFLLKRNFSNWSWFFNKKSAIEKNPPFWKIQNISS